MRSSDEESQGPVIRDRRRIDPATGQVRDADRQAGQGQAGPQRGPAQPRPGRHAVSKPGGTSRGTPGDGQQAPGAAGAAGAPGAAGRQDDAPAPDTNQTDGMEVMTAQLAERTADLQRLQAEYANYRKRVERDRMAVREQALANVLTELLPVLDDIGRAREHGELAGGFKSVAESLEAATVKLGLASYGEDGDPFDPNLHEALMHSYSPDVAEPTCVRILQPGYKVGDRILRPARVAVAEPGEPDEPSGSAHAGHQGNEGGGDDARDNQHHAHPADTSGGD
jgi:molecular chaperone GrpE